MVATSISHSIFALGKYLLLRARTVKKSLRYTDRMLQMEVMSLHSFYLFFPLIQNSRTYFIGSFSFKKESEDISVNCSFLVLISVPVIGSALKGFLKVYFTESDLKDLHVFSNWLAIVSGYCLYFFILSFSTVQFFKKVSLICHWIKKKILLSFLSVR